MLHTLGVSLVLNISKFEPLSWDGSFSAGLVKTITGMLTFTVHCCWLWVSQMAVLIVLEMVCSPCPSSVEALE